MHSLSHRVGQIANLLQSRSPTSEDSVAFIYGCTGLAETTECVSPPMAVAREPQSEQQRMCRKIDEAMPLPAEHGLRWPALEKLSLAMVPLLQAYAVVADGAPAEANTTRANSTAVASRRGLPTPRHQRLCDAFWQWRWTSPWIATLAASYCKHRYLAKQAPQGILAKGTPDPRPSRRCRGPGPARAVKRPSRFPM